MTDPSRSLEPHLKPGERILWSGKPSARPVAQSYRRYGWVGFNIFLVPILIFLMLYDIDEGPAAVMRMPPQYLVISALGALVMLWPRWKGLRASRIAYAITDRRILIAEGGRSRSFRPDALSEILRRDRAHGLSDLTFGPDATETRPRNPLTSEYEHNLAHQPGFFGIKDIKAAEAALVALRDGAR